MSLVKVRPAAQITLPADVHAALQLQEGDYLQAELVEGGVILRLIVAVGKEEAWDRLERVLGEGRHAVSGGELTDEQATALALEVIKNVRRRKREGRL